MPHKYSGIPANAPVKAKADVTCYSEALRFYLSAKVFVAPRTAELGPNLALRRGRRRFDLLLYGSPVVRYYADGSFSVDNCGHNTPTTRSRVNQFTPREFWTYHRAKRLVLPCRYGKDIPLTHAVRLVVGPKGDITHSA